MTLDNTPMDTAPTLEDNKSYALLIFPQGSKPGGYLGKKDENLIVTDSSNNQTLFFKRARAEEVLKNFRSDGRDGVLVAESDLLKNKKEEIIHDLGQNVKIGVGCIINILVLAAIAFILMRLVGCGR
jgi:hypothetical protein